MPTQARGYRTRSALVLAAAHEVDRTGDASMSGVCRRAGVSRGALSHHFSGKQDLLRALRDEARGTLRLLLRYFVADRRPVTEALCRLAEQLFRRLRQDVVLRSGLALLDPREVAVLQAQFTCLVRRRIARERRTAASAPGPERAAALVVSVFGGLEALGRRDPRWWYLAESVGLWQQLGRALAEPEAV
ncbi:TetR family transcriptional regulator [Streptomyces sp. enrichment culture]|uniref:TetR family transcriptional regulator n=1 Tax=Streptomyces sp. enrichment culture TaxID=1795815 RepID=UPI003F56097F